jgi:phosphoribosylglycinamide formyltransferase-1
LRGNFLLGHYQKSQGKNQKERVISFVEFTLNVAGGCLPRNSPTPFPTSPFTSSNFRVTFCPVMTSPLPLGILISGSGSNLQAIIDAIGRRELAARIHVVISNRADAHGLTRAQQHGIPAVVIDHKGFSSREAFEAALIQSLQAHQVELVILAGFMRVLTPFFVRAFPQRIMNIHPALLPAFPGTRAQHQALQYGVRIAGATVHLVDEETDHGPIIMQAAVPVYPDDTEETLSARILAQEHRLYPYAIRLFAEGRLEIRGRSVVVHNESRAPHATLQTPESK